MRRPLNPPYILQILEANARSIGEWTNELGLLPTPPPLHKFGPIGVNYQTIRKVEFEGSNPTKPQEETMSLILIITSVSS